MMKSKAILLSCLLVIPVSVSAWWDGGPGWLTSHEKKVNEKTVSPEQTTKIKNIEEQRSGDPKISFSWGRPPGWKVNRDYKKKVNEKVVSSEQTKPTDIKKKNSRKMRNASKNETELPRISDEKAIPVVYETKPTDVKKKSAHEIKK